MTLRCPVCLREVRAGQAGHLARHQDTAGYICPMSGRWCPTNDEGEDDGAAVDSA